MSLLLLLVLVKNSSENVAGTHDVGHKRGNKRVSCFALIEVNMKKLLNKLVRVCGVAWRSHEVGKLFSMGDSLLPK